MSYPRRVTACERCRKLKRRCDRVRPCCSKCRQTGFPCSFGETSTFSSGGSSSSPSSPSTTFDLACLDTWADGVLESPTANDFINGDSIICSIIAPATSAEVREIRRRNRVRFSCSRCHRMKVKCDKKLPCTRCQNSGMADECSYTHRSSTNADGGAAERQIVSPEPEDFNTVFETFNTRHRGSSHWRILMHRIKALTSIDFHTYAQTQWENLNHTTCDLELIIPVNYPFGSPGAAKYASLKSVMDLLCQCSSSTQTYVDNYFRIFEPLHPIFDPDTPGHGVVPFDISSPPSSVEDLVKLSQYLTVLGLGCSATTGTQANSSDFYHAAEACLMKTPFMFRPSLATLRTLCLMVLTKRVANATCWAIDASWSLAGLMIRLAVMLGLHHTSCECSEEDEVGWADWHARRKLWTTIVYMDVEIAILTGLSSLLRKDEMISCNDLPSPNPLGSPVSQHDDPLYNTFPLIMEVEDKVNSKASTLTYEEAVQYNTIVRQLMTSVGLRRTALDIFFRRVLLVLHRKFAHSAESPFDYPISYWSSLECSLALLVHQHGMLEGGDPGLFEVARVFMLDFFAAALTACIHVLREDAPLSAAAEGVDGAIPPRQTILETLRSSVVIWGSQQKKSLCIRSGYSLLKTIVERIPDETPSLLCI